MRKHDAVHAKSASDAIDRQLEEDFIKSRRQAKVLLLGNDPNQSTLVKNIKLLSNNTLSDEELLAYRPIIYRNALDSAQAFICRARHIGVDYLHPTNIMNADRILDYRVKDDPSFVFSPEIGLAIHELWQDPAVMKRSSELSLSDSATHFLQNILRIGSPDYCPTESDVFRMTMKTSGLIETKLTTGQLTITFIDVSHQKSECKKWIHCFEGITAIIFCASLSDYDSAQERSQTRLHEALILFESVVNSRWFMRTSIVLFLTDLAMFKAKLPKVPLERYFPEYTGGSDVNKAAKHILWRFMQANRARLSVYPHLTELTDPVNLRMVSASVKVTILQNALREYLEREEREPPVLRRILGLIIPKLR